MKGSNTILSALFGAVFCNFLIPPVAVGADSYWKNIADGSFSDLANWFGGVPGSSDTARFTNSSNQRVNWTANVNNANAVFDVASGVLTQAIAGFGWTVTNGYVLGASVSSSSTVSHVSGTLVVTNLARTAQMVLGVDGVGDFRLEGGSVIVDRLVCTNRLRSVIEFPHGQWTALAGGYVDIPNNSEGQGGALLLGTTPGELLRWNLRGGTFKVDNSANGGFGLTILGSVENSKGILTVDGTGSQFQSYSMGIGLGDCQLIVTNGGHVVTTFATIAGFGNNSVLVTGMGSKWELQDSSSSSSIYCAGTSNRIMIANGGTIEVDGLLVEGNFGTVEIVGTGSLFESKTDYPDSIQGSVLAGYNNQIIISDGGTFIELDSMEITMITGDENAVLVRSGGRLIVTNELVYDSGLKVGSSSGRGKLIVDGGYVEATSLVAIDAANSTVDFRSGTITTSGLILNPDNSFVVGDGTGQATLNLTSIEAIVGHSLGLLVLSSNTTLNIHGTNLNATGQLFVTNGPSSQVNLKSGTLYLLKAVVSNGVPFRIGDRIHQAELVLFDNDHLFSDGLVVSSNSALVSFATGLPLSELNPNPIIHGDLRFEPGSSWKFLLGYTSCPQSNTIPHVVGDVRLRALIDVSGASRFVPASQPLFTYTGTLDTNGVSFANVPPGYFYSVDTSNPGEARLNVEFIGPLPDGALANVVRCGTSVSISFATIPGQTYRLEYCDNLELGNWIEFGSVQGTGNIVSVVDSDAGNSERFYRFKTE